MDISAPSERAKALKFNLPPPHQTLNTYHMPAAGLNPRRDSFCPSDSELNVIINSAFFLPGQRELCLLRAFDFATGCAIPTPNLIPIQPRTTGIFLASYQSLERSAGVRDSTDIYFFAYGSDNYSHSKY